MANNEPIAIVGLGCIFPGASNPSEFWATVVNGIDTTTEIPSGRWPLDPSEFYDPRIATPDRVYSTRGGFVQSSTLDANKLRFGSVTLTRLDPLCQLAIHAAQQAWAGTRTGSLDLERVGVILGHIILPTETATEYSQRMLAKEFCIAQGLPEVDDAGLPVDPLNAFPAALPANLVARVLGLSGTAFTLDAACASSLYALALAVMELRSGRADAMLAGGLSRPDPLFTQMGFSQLRALSSRGKPAPFNAEADGLVVGEGAGVVVLKRLSDALEHGDRIRGLISGIGLSNDLQGDLLAPNSEGQLRAMRAAYDEAGWSPAEVDLIECHATGTPLGDSVEVESLKKLWGSSGADDRSRRCVLGSAKSNFGHTLTAAGSAGLIKVLLAIEEGVLPPTANFERAADKLGLESSPFRVLKHPESWKRRGNDSPRRAGLSAFGFGGINAHILIEEWDASKQGGQLQPSKLPTVNPSIRNEQRIAVVGLAAHFGPAPGLDAFQARALSGAKPPEPCDSDSIQEFSLGLNQFRIPPLELQAILPQQSLMLSVAQEAISDARMKPEAGLKTGVLIGIGLDLNTTNYQLRWTMPERVRRWSRRLHLEASEDERRTWLEELRASAGPALTANRTMGSLGGLVASRIAREFRFGGPSFTVSNDENSGNQAIMVAVDWLLSGVLDVAVVGAVDFPSDHRISAATGALAKEAGIRLCDGAGALILKRLDDAIKDGDRIYALIDETDSVTVFDTHCPAKLTKPGHGAVGLAELHSPLTGSKSSLDPLDFIGLPPDELRRCALGRTSSSLGYAGAAAGLASVTKTILSIYQQVIPGNLVEENAETDRRFYQPAGPQFWARNRQERPRRAAVCVGGLGGSQTKIVFEEFPVEPNDKIRSERSRPLGEHDKAIFVLDSVDQDGLLREVESLSRLVAEHKNSIENLARRWWQRSQGTVRGKLKIAIVAGDLEALIARLDQARSRLHGSEANPARRPGERGILAFSGSHSNGQPRVGFVYPGLGNTFAGMGRELSALWPEVVRKQERANSRFRDQITRGTYWNEQLPSQFGDNVDLIVGQVAVGSLVTDIIRLHGIEPNAAIGYSMGETAALVALGAWNDRDELLQRITHSPLFRSELAGASRAARRFWRLPDHEPLDWSAGLVIGSLDQVRDALHGDQSVFLLIENSSQECVIGGRRHAVSQLVNRLKVTYLEIPAVSTVHCPIGSLVEEEYRALHDLPTSPVGVPFYSGVWGTAYRADRKTAAEAITAQAGHTINYPAVIERAYQDGIRVFVEMGPGASCSRMIDQILGTRPHLARSVCAADRDPLETVLVVLAELIAWNVPVDLAPLYGKESLSGHPGSDRAKQGVKASRQIQIQVGRRPFARVKTPMCALPENIGQPASLSNFLELTKAISPMPKESDNPELSGELDLFIQHFVHAQSATMAAHEAYLKVANNLADQIGIQIQRQLFAIEGYIPSDLPTYSTPEIPALVSTPGKPEVPAVLDRRRCLEFAVGSIASVLGSDFAPIDLHPTRVRLPDEPLMLVDRITHIEGKVRTLGEGRVVTEHDVLTGDWYLDANRIAPSIAIESGQADLFLSAYLGIDFETKGLAVYRLLDATVTFHRGLPGPGAVIRYDIRITKFFRQGETHLFRFEFDGTVDGEPLLTMRDGCAGFFSPEELASGKGIVPRPLDSKPRTGVRPDNWSDLVPPFRLSLDEIQVGSLRRGEFASAFGAAFDGLEAREMLGLPGGRMSLVDRVETLDTTGGRFGLGVIRTEADIHPGDWFMVCHFVDDRVMPGTLMYEGCLHTLRIFLMSLGWIGEASAVAYEPVHGVGSRLRCRGQVVETTRKVTYEVTIKEIGFRPEPYAIADALMYSDGRPIVEIADMSLQLTGASRTSLEALWIRSQQHLTPPPVLFDQAKLLEFANGKPSLAFGEPYRPFDKDRFIARLPRPPYQFLTRILEATIQPWVLEAGGAAEAEYDVPTEAWYFDADRQDRLPFAVLLEIPLQTCGWMAAYMGSALRSSEPLKFRNLGGTGCQHAAVNRNSGTLRIHAKFTKVSSSAGMILQHYEFSVSGRDGLIYDGKTYFGFFHPDSLAEQVGIRESTLQILKPGEKSLARSFEMPPAPPFPDRKLRMIDHVTALVSEGGEAGLGFIEGATGVDPNAWFFQAHFLQDPVWPGSLGLESLLQLLKVVASARWGSNAGTEFESVALGEPHHWEYRGQVVPTNRRITVQVTITARDDHRRFLRADGLLSVDGKVIYQMKGFTLRLIG